MKKMIPSILSLVFSIIALIFSLMFQSMAYWGPGKTLSMKCYWIGVIVSYFFSIMTVFIMFIKLKQIELTQIDLVLRLFSSSIMLISLFLTTFIIIAWESGF
ncbi:MAG: hypothetical protein Q8934_01390 [Bacillota bacterium]|nr:hypothetical protein [Bacillota bacterium]